MSIQPSNHKSSDDTPLIPNPVNLDRPIQELQMSLAANLPWLDRSFGRSWISYKQIGKKTTFYPEVFQGSNKDPLNVAPGNDNLKSYSFFRVHEPGVVSDFEQHQFANFKYTISIIFWFNLKRIDSVKNYDFTEELKADIQRVITNHTFSAQSNIKILRIYETAERVFDGYTIQTVERQQLVYPHRGLRFECELGHLEDC